MTECLRIYSSLTNRNFHGSKFFAFSSLIIDKCASSIFASSKFFLFLQKNLDSVVNDVFITLIVKSRSWRVTAETARNTGLVFSREPL